MSELVTLGRLGRPHGIRGEIRVDYYAESPLLLEKPLLLRAGRSMPRPVRVASWRYWQDKLIVRLEGVDDRSAAEMLRGQELLIEDAHLPELEEDETYLHDMLGLPVFAREENAELRPIGALDHLLFPTDQEIWSIRAYGEGEPGADPLRASGHEILFPAVPDFVEDIDLEAGRIIIAPPAGLLELYAPEEKDLTEKAPVRTKARRQRPAQTASTPKSPDVQGR